MALTADTLRRISDHTLLAPEATPERVEAFLERAREIGVDRVCLSPSALPVDSRGLEIVTVVGFPSGAHHAEMKAAEAARALADGAHEIDMVVNPALVRAGDWEALAAEIAAVRAVVPAPRILKVIIESASLSDEEIAGACRAAVRSGADFVKTSTGFHPAGGASVHAVRLMAHVCDGAVGIKASGGIRTPQDAAEMLAAGATRLGLSATAEMIEEIEGDGSLD